MSLVTVVLDRLGQALWPFRRAQPSPELVQYVQELQGMVHAGSQRFIYCPVSLSLAYFPGVAFFDVRTELNSNYGIETEFPAVERQFDEEVSALTSIIEDEGPSDPNDSVARMNFSMAKRAHAMAEWGRIAVPIRLSGDQVVHIRAPRDLMGSPVISSLPLAEFLPLVAEHTALDRFRIIQLEAQLTVWKCVAAALAIAGFLLW